MMMTIDPHLPTIDDCLRMTKAGAAAPGELPGRPTSNFVGTFIG